jgi:hypothetical protein
MTKFQVSRVGAAQVMLLWIKKRNNLLSMQLVFLLLLYLIQRGKKPKNCFGFLHHLGYDCSNTSKKLAAMIFRVTVCIPM